MRRRAIEPSPDSPWWPMLRFSIPSWRIWSIGCGLLLGDQREWGLMFDIGPIMVEVLIAEANVAEGVK